MLTRCFDARQKTLFALATLFSFPAHSGLFDFPKRCDVVVVGASLGGVMAALESARGGAKTCLLAETNWLGGQLTTQGICAIDAPHQFGPVWKELLADFAAPREKGSAVVQIVKKNDLIPVGEYSLKTPSLLVDESIRCLRPLLNHIHERAHCWVSYDCCRPSSADTALKEMAEPYVKSGKLRIWYDTVLQAVRADRHGIRQISALQRKFTGRGLAPYDDFYSSEVIDWYTPKNSMRYKKHRIHFTARTFIDGTETGELIALSGAQHRLGESNPDCSQKDPELVMGFVSPLNLAVKEDSSEFAQSNIRAMEQFLREKCSAFIPSFDEYAKNNFHIEWKSYRFWSSPQDSSDMDFKKGLPFEQKPSLLGYRRISDDPEVTMMNFGQSIPFPDRLTDRRGGNDYIWGNFIIPESQLGSQLKGSWRGGIRAEELLKAECHSLAFAKWLRLQPEVKEAPAAEGRNVVPVFSRPASADGEPNFFDTGTGMSKMPYVRDTRRIAGFRNFCMNIEGYGVNFKDFADEPDKVAVLEKFRDSKYYAGSPSSIGIASYPFDRRKYPNGVYPVLPQNDMKMSEIPLEALVSNNVPNLLVAGKGISLHQIVASAARTQPFECNVGRGAGAAAAESVARKKNLHELLGSSNLIRAVQERVIEGGGTTGWFVPRRMPVSE